MARVYDLRAWHRVRKEQLSREPLCRHCHARGVITVARHVDHIIAIERGGAWFDADNLQSLCHACHNAKTARDEGHAASMGVDVNGNPVDPTHHWNQGEGGV